MPLGTLDRTPPPFFKQGPSALSKLMVFSALALFLMVADMRFRITVPVRSALATALYPDAMAGDAAGARGQRARARISPACTRRRPVKTRHCEKLATQSEHALQVEQLRLENQRLRELLAMRERILDAIDRRPGTVRRGRPVFAPRGDRPRPDPRRGRGLTGDRRQRCARPGHTGVSPDVRSHPADRQRLRHSRAQRAHRRAQRGLWPHRTQMAKIWSCATPWPTPTSSKATC